MRIIYLKRLADFAHKHAEAKKSLSVWKSVVENEVWETPQDILKAFPTAKIINGRRSRFKINGNKYRIVIEVDFDDRLVEIRFVGTHSAYNKIDAKNI